MKAFRGTLLAALAVAGLGVAWWLVRPQPSTTGAPTRARGGMEQAERLFPFEKADLVKVDVRRPDGALVLEERGDGWWIAGEEQRASRSMVSRVKHQLHDLSARATLVPDAGEDGLYGLGSSAIRVVLTMRDGSTVAFSAGDPNPTGVSFYLRRDGDPRVYTVKKSAVDYYSLALDEFRERRFAAFDSKDVDALDAALPEGQSLAFQRTGDAAWDMLTPSRFAAEPTEVVALLGRVSALKAIRFVDAAGGDLARFGLAAPRARITLRFSGREPLTLLLGKRFGEKDGEYELAYAAIDGEPSIYAVRDDLLTDWGAAPERFRLRRFARVVEPDVTAVTCALAPSAVSDDPRLAGTTTAKSVADPWTWEDGTPVAGSTPRRVVSQAAALESTTFVGESADDRRYGFAAPRLTLTLARREGEPRALVLGAAAPSLKVPPGPEGGAPREVRQAYARVVGLPEVYTVDEGLLDVCRDLRREASRKSEGDAEKSARQQRIREERGATAP